MWTRRAAATITNGMRYSLPDAESPAAFDAQVATLAAAIRATVAEIMANGEPGTKLAAALAIAVEELPREDSLAFRETLSRAISAVRDDLAAEHVRDHYGYELRRFGARLPSAETRAAILRDTLSNVACDTGLDATDVVTAVRCVVDVELLAGAARGLRAETSWPSTPFWVGAA